MITEKVKKAVKTNQLSQTVFTLKKEKSYCSVEYCKLDSIYLSDWYTILQLEQCIVTLSEVKNFRALNGISEYWKKNRYNCHKSTQLIDNTDCIGIKILFMKKNLQQLSQRALNNILASVHL